MAEGSIPIFFLEEEESAPNSQPRSGQNDEIQKYSKGPPRKEQKNLGRGRKFNRPRKPKPRYGKSQRIVKDEDEHCDISSDSVIYSRTEEPKSLFEDTGDFTEPTSMFDTGGFIESASMFDTGDFTESTSRFDTGNFIEPMMDAPWINTKSSTDTSAYDNSTDIREDVSLQPIQIDLLKKCNYFKNYDKLKVIYNSPDKITFIGPNGIVQKAQLTMFQNISSATEQSISLSPAIINILKNKSGQKYLQEKLPSSVVCKLYPTELTCLALSMEDSSSFIDSLRDDIVTKSINIGYSIENEEGWALSRRLELNYPVRVTTSCDALSKVTIEGLGDYVITAIKELQDHIKENRKQYESSEQFKVDGVTAKFIHLYCTTETNEILDAFSIIWPTFHQKAGDYVLTAIKELQDHIKENRKQYESSEQFKVDGVSAKFINLYCTTETNEILDAFRKCDGQVNYLKNSDTAYYLALTGKKDAIKESMDKLIKLQKSIWHERIMFKDVAKDKGSDYHYLKSTLCNVSDDT